MKRILLAILFLTVSTQAFSAVDDANTISLLHFDGNIADEAGVGWATIGTTANDPDGKFSSARTFGSGYIIGSAGLSAIGTGDFTVDFWAKGSCNGSLFAVGGAPDLWIIGFDGTTIYLLLPLSMLLGVQPANDGRWHHIAFCRQSGNVKQYVDGVEKGSSYCFDYVPAGDFYIGNSPDEAWQFGGSIDEFRVSKICRWTSDFSVPTAPYTPAQAVNGLSFAPSGSIGISGSGKIGLR